jgi:hypothetical protein
MRRLNQNLTKVSNKMIEKKTWVFKVEASSKVTYFLSLLKIK